MKRTLLCIAALALAACGDSTPPPKPVVQPVTPAPQVQAPEAPKAPETKPEAAKPDPNKELAQRVKQAIDSDGKVQPGSIDVTAKDGRVSLWGTAASAGERTRAGQIAAKIEGVASVDNQIKIVKGS